MKGLIISILFLPTLLSYTIPQWKHIRHLLQNDIINEKQKNLIRDKIYNDHVTNWTLYNSWEFKRKFSSQKIVRDINIYELNYYAIKGLHYACRKYNGSRSFYLYAKPILHYSLLNAITDSHSINNRIPHKFLTSKKWKQNNSHIFQLHMLSPIYTSDINKEIYTNVKQNSNHIKIKEINEIVQSMNGYDRSLFYYRYDINTLKKKKNYKELEERFCFSHEKLRRDLKKIHNNITYQLHLYN